MQRLAPFTFRTINGQKLIEPIYERYERFYNNIVKGDSQAKVKLRHQLFGAGADMIAFVPPRYTLLQLALEKQIPIAELESMSLSQRGEILAVMRLNNMRDTLERHLEIQRQDSERRENSKKHGNGKTPKA